MQFLLPLLCFAFLFAFNTHAADKTDRECTPPRVRDNNNKLETDQNNKRCTPSRIRKKSSSGEAPQIEISPGIPKENLALPKKRSHERIPKKTLDLKIPVEKCTRNTPPTSPTKSPGKNYYLLWELNLKNIPGPPTFICPEGEADKTIVKKVLASRTIDHLFFVESREIDNLDGECGGDLDEIFGELKIKLKYIKDIYACEKAIVDIDLHENTESIFIIGLSGNKINYNLLAQLTINGHIKDAQARETHFNVNGKSILVDGRSAAPDYLFDEAIAMRIAGELNNQALLRIFTDESRKNGMLTVADQGELQKYCLRRLFYLWPQDIQRACTLRYQL